MAAGLLRRGLVWQVSCRGRRNRNRRSFDWPSIAFLPGATRKPRRSDRLRRRWEMGADVGSTRESDDRGKCRSVLDRRPRSHPYPSRPLERACDARWSRRVCKSAPDRIAAEGVASFVDEPHLERFRPLLAPIGNGERAADHVVAVAMPGHAPGHMGYVLDTGEDRILFRGELSYVPAAQFARPELTSATMTISRSPAQREAGCWARPHRHGPGWRAHSWPSRGYG